jgi:hypothetical protein
MIDYANIVQDRTHSDNIYPEGTFITAKEHPGVKLMIVKYLQRIYYCVPAKDPNQKQLAYFEQELIPPGQ